MAGFQNVYVRRTRERQGGPRYFGIRKNNGRSYPVRRGKRLFIRGPGKQGRGFKAAGGTRWTSIPLYPLRTGRTFRAFIPRWPLYSLRTGWTLLARRALYPLRTSRTLRTFIARRALYSLRTRRTLWAFLARWPLYPLRTGSRLQTCAPNAKK